MHYLYKICTTVLLLLLYISSWRPLARLTPAFVLYLMKRPLFDAERLTGKMITI